MAKEAQNLHVDHIESVAARGETQEVKNVFNHVIKFLSGTEKQKQEQSGTETQQQEKSITEKLDGVPVLFGHTDKDGYFVGLKNRCFKNNKFEKSAAFFTTDFSKAGDNAPLLQNMWDTLVPLVQKNTVYFAELVFSTHEKSPNDRRVGVKQQKLQHVGGDSYLVQPNLLWYKISGATGQEKLGLLEISVAEVTNLNQLELGSFVKKPFNLSSKDLYITTGQLRFDKTKLGEKVEETLKEVSGLVNSFNFVNHSKFRVSDYFTDQSDPNYTQYKPLKEAKDKLIQLLDTLRNVRGYKDEKLGKEVNEGFVVNYNGKLYKFISSGYKEASGEHYGKNKKKKKVTQNSSYEVTSSLTNVLQESENFKFAVLFMGKFQPFHIGHHEVFKQLQKTWGKKNVYILTSNTNKVGKQTLPGTYLDKEQVIKMYGQKVSTKLIERTPGLAPYNNNNARVFFAQKNPSVSVYVWAVGGKDSDRLSGKENFYEVSNVQELREAYAANPKGTFWTRTPVVKIGDETVSARNIRGLTDPNSNSVALTKLKKFFPEDVLRKLQKNKKAKSALAKILGVDSITNESLKYGALLRLCTLL